jgi:hypothetical protein
MNVTIAIHPESASMQSCLVEVLRVAKHPRRWRPRRRTSSAPTE